MSWLNLNSLRKRYAALTVLLGVVMLGFGMVVPIFPFYIDSMGASGSELGLLVAISPFMQLVMSPVWGSASDRHSNTTKHSMSPSLCAGKVGFHGPVSRPSPRCFLR